MVKKYEADDAIEATWEDHWEEDLDDSAFRRPRMRRGNDGDRHPSRSGKPGKRRMGKKDRRTIRTIGMNG
jgi:hypothetical protein